MDFRGKRGDWGFVFECPICTQVLRGPLKLCQVCGSTSWVGHVIFMPKYGSFDVSQVTWAKYSMLIGRENFCCAVIGRDLLETPSLLLPYGIALEEYDNCCGQTVIEHFFANVSLDRKFISHFKPSCVSTITPTCSVSLRP